eukprot:Nitzschia sp. Nitz4//scaffold287_size23745//20544//20747//NITZ4_008462-RA/size23745-processed-gene-0.10-mRNA-1//1//CDS//3329545775//7174//frame0
MAEHAVTKNADRKTEALSKTEAQKMYESNVQALEVVKPDLWQNDHELDRVDENEEETTIVFEPMKYE